MAQQITAELEKITRPAAPIPITILTGFLGAGKTTLLNRLLSDDHGLRMAVLVNDFGEINIDSQMVTGIEGEDLISLANGCVCCTIRGDLLDSVLRLLRRELPPEHIVIEASGISYPFEVARTFLLPDLAPYIRLEAVLAIIDTEQVLTLDGEAAVLAAEQVSAADIVLLNKVDLTEEGQVDEVRAWAKQIVPVARIVETTFAQVPLELLLGVDFSHSLESNLRHEDPIHAFTTWHYETDAPISFTAFKDVLRTFPPNILRAKGFIHFAEVPDRRSIFQLVGKRTEIYLGEGWAGKEPKTEVVFISSSSEMDTEDLRLRFESCRMDVVGEGMALMSAQEVESWVEKGS